MTRLCWIQANSTHWNNCGLTLIHRLRRWPNMKTTSFQCLLFATHYILETMLVCDAGPTLNQLCVCWDTLSGVFPENKRQWPNVVLMLAHRLRRQHNNKTTLGQCLVLAGLHTHFVYTIMIQCTHPGLYVDSHITSSTTRRSTTEINLYCTSKSPGFLFNIQIEYCK